VPSPDEIEAPPIRSLAKPDCALFLWLVNHNRSLGTGVDALKS